MGITVIGLKSLQQKLKDNVTMDDVARVVQKNGNDLVRTMKAETTTAYRGGYSGVIQSTGDTAGSIVKEARDGGLTAVVKPTTNYVQYVEYGTRFMPPEPIAQPSLDKVKPKFLNDLERLMKQ